MTPLALAIVLLQHLALTRVEVQMQQAGCPIDRPLAAEIARWSHTPLEAAVLVSLAKFEGQCSSRAVGDHGTSYGAFQQHGRPGEWAHLLGNERAQVQTALVMIRGSFAACHALPESERLAVYTRGRCDSERGRELSRARMRLAREVMR